MEPNGGVAAESVVSSGLCDDAIAPVVSVDGYPNNTYTSIQDAQATSITFTGTATDNKGVVEVKWNASYSIVGGGLQTWPHGSGIAEGTSTWTIANMPTPTVDNWTAIIVNITAYDFCGNPSADYTFRANRN